MTVTVLRDDKFSKEYEVTISAQDLQQAKEEWIVANAPKMKVDGFRPGKAPLKVLMSHYGSTAREKAINKMLAEKSKNLCEENNMKDAVLIDLDLIGTGEFGEKFKFSFEVPPQFEIGDLKRIKVDNLVITPEDEEVEEVIRGFRLKLGQQTEHTAEDSHAIQEWDDVTYDIQVEENGTILEQNILKYVTLGFEKHPGYMLIAEKIKGHKIGDTITINDVKMDDLDGEWKCINGKTVSIVVTIKGVTSTQPADDEALLKDIDTTDSLESLKAKIKEFIVDAHIGKAETCHKRYIFDALDTAFDFEVSTDAVEKEYNKVWNVFLEEQKEFQEKGEEHPDMKGKTLEEVKADYMRVAERRVGLCHILKKVTSEFKINLTEQDVYAYANCHIRSLYPRAFDLWSWRMREDESFRDAQIAIIQENKIAQFLHSQASHNDISVTPKELTDRLIAIMPE